MGLAEPSFSGATPASYRLDLPGGSWTRIADAPLLNNRAKIGASAITVGGEVYLIGGYTISRTSEVTEPRLFRYDLASDSYEERAMVPTPVDDTVVGVFQDRYLYLISGWNGPSNNNTLAVQFYDTQQNVWSGASEMPGPHTGLFGHAGTILGDRIVVADGVATDGGFGISDDVWVGQIDPAASGDLAHIEWQAAQAHPGSPTYRAAVSQGAVAEDSGQLLLLGGTSNPYNFTGIGYDNQPSLPLDQALLFRPATGEWTPLAIDGEPLPTMDHRGLVAVPGGWATIGGMTAPRAITDQVVQYRLGGVACVPEDHAMAPALVILSVLLRRRVCRRQLQTIIDGRWLSRIAGKR